MILDEYSTEKGVSKRQTWSFGYSHKKFDHNKVAEYPKGKQGSVMVWASVGGTSGQSELIIMSRDEKSPRSGYTTASYLETLEDSLLLIHDGETFMQDNALIHTLRAARVWFEEHGMFLNSKLAAIQP